MLFVTVRSRVVVARTEGLVMLQTLLVDRFKLVMHRETKDFSMWALVIARR